MFTFDTLRDVLNFFRLRTRHLIAFDCRKYGCTTVQVATFSMRGQLYRGHANATALFSSPVVSALGSESDDPGSSPGRGKALCP